MDAKIIDPFIDSTLHVLETMASIEAKAGKPYLREDQIAKGDITGVIGLTGQIKGTISISCYLSTYLTLHSNCLTP